MSYEADRYGGAVAWDRYCERMEARSRWIEHNEYCEGCSNCRLPEKDFYTDRTVGWCAEHEMFVDIDAHPADYDCEEWS